MNRITLSALLILLICSSCTTYELSISILKSRFDNVDSSDLVLTKVRGPFGERYTYYTHPNKTIIVIDKEGQEVNLNISPSLEMRVTHHEGKKTYFYLDKVYVNDRFLIGDRSRFSDLFQKKIALEAIEKIEVQDGKKNFHYY